MAPDDQAKPAARIVAGIDGSPSSREALAWAARQAEMTDASLEVVIAWEWPNAYGWVPTLPPGYDPAAEARKVLDPLVVGNRGHGEFAGMLLGSVSEHCAGNAHCPVVVYRKD